MTSISNRLVRICKSRSVLLEQLESRDYNVDDYSQFSITEVDAMFTNSQLDMLIQHKTDGSKLYVKYNVSPTQTTKQINKTTLDNIIEDLFSIEEVLQKKDTLIIVMDDEPNDTILEKLRYLYDRDGIFVILHNIQRLQFNILKHALVPYMRVLKDDEVREVMQKYNIQNTKQFPEISRFDPQALAVGVRPGNVCYIARESPTALVYDYYRICV
jgi:DNA-directed RNA polymerase subunit H (RpoH/RPB5)